MLSGKKRALSSRERLRPYWNLFFGFLPREFHRECDRNSRPWIAWISPSVSLIFALFVFTDFWIMEEWSWKSPALRLPPALLGLTGTLLVSLKKSPLPERFILIIQIGAICMGMLLGIPLIDDPAVYVFAYFASLFAASVAAHAPPVAFLFISSISSLLCLYLIAPIPGPGVAQFKIFLVLMTPVAIVFYFISYSRFHREWHSHYKLRRQRILLKRQNQSFLRELRLAGLVQHKLLPAINEKSSPLILDYKYLPAEKVAGDLIEIIPLRDGQYFVMVADVVGHGVSAALLSTMLKMTIRNMDEDVLLDPGATLDAANQSLYTHLENHFITAFCAVIDAREKKINYASAGHHESLLLKESDRTLEKLQANGPAIGLKTWAKYETREDRLPSGSILLIYTDGCMEILDKNNRLMTEEEFHEIVLAHLSEPREAFLDAIVKDVRENAGEGHPTDDISILSVRI